MQDMGQGCHRSKVFHEFSTALTSESRQRSCSALKSVQPLGWTRRQSCMPHLGAPLGPTVSSVFVWRICQGGTPADQNWISCRGAVSRKAGQYVSEPEIVHAEEDCEWKCASNKLGVPDMHTLKPSLELVSESRHCCSAE